MSQWPLAFLEVFGQESGAASGLNQLEIEKHSVGGIRRAEQGFSVLIKPL